MLRRYTGVIGIALIVALVLFAAPEASALGIYDGVHSARGDGQPRDLFGAGGVLTTITNILLFIVGALSVIMIIVGGLRYVLSAGNSTAVTAAKNTILYAVVGLVVAFLAFAAINFVISALAPGSNSGYTDI
jgi:hypothetical protein